MPVEIVAIFTLIGTVLTFVTQIFQSCMTGAFESDCGCFTFKHKEEVEQDININIEVSIDQSSD